MYVCMYVLCMYVDICVCMYVCVLCMYYVCMYIILQYISFTLTNNTLLIATLAYKNTIYSVPTMMLSSSSIEVYCVEAFDFGVI
jgi:hypothetical protein